MKKSVLAVALLLLFPLISGAAGFAKKTIFLSKSSIVIGESAILYAPISNTGSQPFAGSVAFSDGASTLGNVVLDLDAGEARVASISWKPSTAGSHTITAKLQNADGTVIETQTGAFAVGPEPTKKKELAQIDQSAAAVDSSKSIRDNIAKVSPAVASASAPFFETVDAWRQSASDVLDGQLASVKPKLPGNVLGVQTSGGSATSVPSTDIVGSGFGILWTLYFYLLSIVNFVLISAAIFYPVLAVLFIYILWKIYQRMSGRNYRY